MLDNILLQSRTFLQYQDLDYIIVNKVHDLHSLRIIAQITIRGRELKLDRGLGYILARSAFKILVIGEHASQTGRLTIDCFSIHYILYQFGPRYTAPFLENEALSPLYQWRNGLKSCLPISVR